PRTQSKMHSCPHRRSSDLLNAADPDPETFHLHEFALTPNTEEKGERRPANGEKTTMVDAALHAVDDILKEYPEALFYGQDVGGEDRKSTRLNSSHVKISYA